MLSTFENSSVFILTFYLQARYRFPRAHFFGDFLCARQRKLPAGGDGGTERQADIIGEFAVVGAFAASGRDGNRTRAFRLRATPFLTAEKWGKDAPGNHSIKVPRTLPHGQRGSAPCGIPGEGLRRTKDVKKEKTKRYPTSAFAPPGGNDGEGRPDFMRCSQP